MKHYETILACLLALFIGSNLRAQELQGTVCDTEKQPLVGAAVYWAGTTVGASADVDGRFRLHRVKGYDRLVATYLGYVNDTLQIAPGVERAEFAQQAEDVAMECVTIEGNLTGHYIKKY